MEVKKIEPNTHRHQDNPLEQKAFELAQQFSDHHISQIVYSVDGTGRPEEYITEREKIFFLIIMQWIASPVGQGFLDDLGFPPHPDPWLEKEPIE